MPGPGKSVEKKLLRRSITALRRHSPGTLLSGRGAGDRHEPALGLSDPADIQGGDAVANERPSRVSDTLSVRTHS
jgi:hypothetical protein